MNEVWRVQLATGEVRMMSLDELDRAFDAGWIHERTNVLAPGSFKWTTLGDAAGLNEPEPQSYVEQTPSLAPMAIAGSQYSLPNIPQHQYSTSMSSFGLDDEDFGQKKSKKGLIFGFMVAAAAATCAYFVTTGKIGGVINGAAVESKATATLAPAAEQKLPEPAKAPSVEEKMEEPKTAAAGMTDEMKKKLLEADQLRADKIKAKLEKAGKKAGRRMKGRPDGDSAPASNPEGGKLIQGGDKYDPLNGSI